MKNVLLLCLGLSTATVFAQAPAGTQQQAQQTNIPGTAASKGNARISGVVVDATTKQPVEFATVALINVATGKPIDGTMADDKGRFTLSKIAAGKYNVNVSFLGYQAKLIKEVTLNSDNASLDLGSITLASDTKSLSEVVVTGEKPLVEEKIDRTVYNAEKDLTNVGGNAADVLQKVPSLSVDIDGNVQLRGSSNVRVLVNNKPSSIMAGSIADALKQIPADMIKSVEVITSPSAKYDAEGTAGIINIITKKDSGLQGVNGTAALTAGTRSSGANASLNIRRGKLGINGNLGSHMFYNKGDLTNTIIVPAENSITRQFGDSRMNGRFLNTQLGFDYDITPKNSLSGGIRLNSGRFKMSNDQDISRLENEVENETKSFSNAITNENQRQGIDVNLDFTHYFENPGQELALLSLYSVTEMDNKISQDRYFTGQEPHEMLRNTNDGGNKELTFQADYTHPFKNKTVLEIGAKSIFRDVESDADYRTTRLNGENESDKDVFFYEQDVIASYLTYGFAVKKLLNVKLGGRYEYTDITANLISDEKGFKPNYDNFVPSVALSYSLKGKHFLKANFTQRIQRPSLFFLNPYRQEQTSNTFVQGNPKLDAELTNMYELGYSTFFKTTSINASLYMRQTDNAIETVPTYDSDLEATILTFDNIAKNKTYGISLFGSTKPVNAWTIGGSSNIYFVDLKSSMGGNNGWMYNINMNSSYDFGKGISGQFNGGFNSRRIQLQGEFASFSYHSLAFKKELFDKKGGISVGFDNPFRAAMRMKTDVYTSEYEQHIVNNNYNRGVKVTFNYAFGKIEQQRPPKRKKSIRNDDTKQGDGNGVQ